MILNDKEFQKHIQIMKDNVKNQYALSYIDALEESYSLYGDEGVKVQILYI